MCFIGFAGNLSLIKRFLNLFQFDSQFCFRKDDQVWVSSTDETIKYRWNNLAKTKKTIIS